MKMSNKSKNIPVASKIPTSGRDSGTHSRSSSVSNLTTASDTHSEAGDVAIENIPDFKLDEKVWVNGSKPGCIKFIGKTQFAPGIWAGVLLEESTGKNDGSVAGIKYFSCEPLKGIFTRLQKLSRSPGAIAGTGDFTAAASASPRINANTPLPSSRTPLSSSISSTSPRSCSKLRTNERVDVSSTTGVKSGILRFIGETDFAKGEWAGIELDEPVGKNDGSVAGKRYFNCQMKHGLFAPLHKVSRAGGTSVSRSSSIRGTPLMRSASKDSLSSSVSNCSKSSRVKLGVTSLTNTQKTRLTGAGIMTNSRALEEVVKEKEQCINQMLKERDFDRAELVRIAKQYEQVEALNFSLKKEQQKFEDDHQKLDEQLSISKRKLEDLQFQLEEEKIAKSDIEMQLSKVSGVLKKIEDFSNKNCVGRVINIKEILEGKENISEISDIQESTEKNVSNKRIEELEDALKKLLDEKNKVSNEVSELKNILHDTVKKNEEHASFIDNSIQEKDDIISNLKNELSAQLEKVTLVLEENQSLKNQIITIEAQSKGQTDEVIKELGEQISSLKDEITMKCHLVEEKDLCIKEKEEVISKMNEKLEIQASISVDLQNSKSELNQALEQKDDIIDKISAELKNAKDELILLKTKVDSDISNKEEKIFGLVQEIEKLTNSLQEKDECLINKQKEVDSLQKIIDEMKITNDALNIKRLETDQLLSHSSKDSSEQIDTLKKEITKLKEEKSLADSSNEKKLQEVENELKDKLQLEQRLSTDLKSQKSSMEKLLEDKATECKELKINIESIKATELNLQEELKKISSNLEEKEKALNQIEMEVKSKNEKLEFNEKLIHHQESNIADLNERINDLNSLCDKVKVECDASKTLSSVFEKEKEELSVTLKTKEEMLSELLIQIESAKESLNTSHEDLILEEKKIAELKESLRMKEEETKQLASKLTLAEQKVEMLNKDSSDHVKSLQNELSKVKEESVTSKLQWEQDLKKLKDEKEKLSTNIISISNSVKEKEDQCSTFSNTLKEKENVISNLTMQVENLYKELTIHKEANEKQSTNSQNEIATLKDGFAVDLKSKDQIIAEMSLELSKLKELEIIKDEEATKTSKEIATLKNMVSEKETQFDELMKDIEASQLQLLKLKENNENNVALLKSKESFINDFKTEQLKIVQKKELMFKSELSKLESELRVKEQEINDKDLSVKNAMTESEEQVKKSKTLESEIEKLKEQKEKDAQESKHCLDELSMKISELEQKYFKLLDEKEEIAKEERKNRDAKKTLEQTRDSLLEENAKKEEAVKDREARLEALQAVVSRMQVELAQHKQELQQKLDISEMELQANMELKKQLELQHSVNEELQQELKNSEVVQKSLEEKIKTLSAVVTEKQQMHTQIEEFEKLSKEKTEKICKIEEKVQILEKQLSNSKNLVSLKEKEIEVINEQLMAKEKDGKSVESLLMTLKSVEEENVSLKNKVSTLESSLSETKVNAPVSLDDESNQLDAHERESYCSQINFLNSIIVDMKQKNEDLTKQLELQTTCWDESDLNLNTEKKIPPRLFCDICDMFDLHDTDDCPKQESYIEEDVPKLRPHGSKQLEERPYCNNCEVFGHWTFDCAEPETY